MKIIAFHWPKTDFWDDGAFPSENSSVTKNTNKTP